MIALRFMQSKTSNRFLSFITWISTLGLILGVASLVVVTSVLNGFEEALTTRILGMVPHASVSTQDGIDNWKRYADKIRENDEEIVAVAPFITTRGMSLINGELHGSIVNGIDSDYQGEVSVLPIMMVEGDINSLKPDHFNIILGKSLVDARGLKLGDKVNIMLAIPSDSSAGVEPKFFTFKLSGVYSVSEQLDSWMSYISIDDAATILEKSNNPIGLRFKLKDIMDAENSAKKASKLLNAANISNFPLTWKDTHQSLYDSIKTQKTMMSLLLFLIIVVAMFNVISALIMMTTEKRSEIAILRTFGASKKEIIQIFLSQGLVIGALGTAVGFLAGIAISLSIGTVSEWVDTTFNLRLFDHYFVTSLPAKLNPIELLLICLVSMLSCLLASVYPAIKAANIPPAEALKYE